MFYRSVVKFVGIMLAVSLVFVHALVCFIPLAHLLKVSSLVSAWYAEFLPKSDYPRIWKMAVEWCNPIEHIHLPITFPVTNTSG